MTRLVAVAVVALALLNPCFAWNRGGHLVSGALAYSELNKSSPKSVDAAITVLQSHPAFSHWQKELDESAVTDKRKALFMLAAAFPDDVRRGQFKRFDHPDWHYVNFRYSPTEPQTDVARAEPFNGKLMDMLQSSLATYKEGKTATADRAVALSWVLHLSGDLTQPLHVTALVNGDFPKGDRGGNDVYVRGSERSTRSVNLHKLWDDGATGAGVSLAKVANLATELEAQVPALPTVTHAWQAIRNEAAASYRLAVENAYLNGKLGYAIDDDAEAPLLPPDYTQRLKALSLQQMIRSAALATQLLR